MRFIDIGILAMAPCALAMPQDAQNKIDAQRKIDAITSHHKDNDPFKPNETHAFIKVDGDVQVLDLTTDDVIREEHVIRKPLGPDSFFNSSVSMLAPSEAGDLSKRQEGYCSMYFGCRDEYITVQGSLWSYWVTRYGSGEALGGRRSGWTSVDATGSEIRTFGSGQAFSGNSVYSGCHIQFDISNCHIDVPSSTNFASYNCAGCP